MDVVPLTSLSLGAALIAFVQVARESLGANREGGVEWIPETGETRPAQT